LVSDRFRQSAIHRAIAPLLRDLSSNVAPVKRSGH
jgi:hypothetical protein